MNESDKKLVVAAHKTLESNLYLGNCDSYCNKYYRPIGRHAPECHSDDFSELLETIRDLLSIISRYNPSIETQVKL